MAFQKGRSKTGGRRKGGPYRKLDPKLTQKLQQFLDDGFRISPLDAMLGVLKIRIEEGTMMGLWWRPRKPHPIAMPSWP
jgi:hypothetical protein